MAAEASAPLRGIGNPTLTRDQGDFRISLPQEYRPGQSVELMAELKGWEIWQPTGGRLIIPERAADAPKVLLRRPGDRRFLRSQGVEDLLVQALRQAKEQAAKDRPRTPIDNHGAAAAPAINLSGSVREWATRYGLSAAQVQAEVDRWVAAAKQNHAQDEQKRCLVAVAERRFGDAARCFEAEGSAEAQEVQKLREQALARLETAMESFRRAGDAHEANYDFAAALAVYERAHRLVCRDEAPALWAETLNLLGIVKNELGTRVDGPAMHRYLAQALSAYRLALQVYTREQHPQHWAMVQNNLANALADQAARTPGEAGARLLSDAVTAYRLALLVYTHEQHPQQWAMTHNNLAIALAAQAARTPGAASARLLPEAISSYHLALQVRTRELLPQDWAMTQNNLAAALADQAACSTGAAGARLLADAVSAFRLALLVFTREQLPQQWAGTQNNLAVALKDQAARTTGPDRARLLLEAEAALRATLTIFTYEALPQHWAQSQRDLLTVCQLRNDSACVTAAQTALRRLTSTATPFW